MKNKLSIGVLVFICVLTYSCSNDDDYESKAVENANVKTKQQIHLKNELTKKIIDPTNIIFNKDQDGDPSNPKPPRN